MTNKIKELVIDLAGLQIQLLELQELIREKKRQLAKEMGKMKSVSVPFGEGRVTMTKVKRLVVKDRKLLPPEVFVERRVKVVDLKKLRELKDKLPGIVEEVEDVRIRITENGDDFTKS